MADVVDKATRSRMMAGIKGKDTKPEILIRSELHRRGFRFRKNVKELPGKPDIVLPKYKTIVMVNGCFWHRHHGCKYASTPATRPDFWEGKFKDNVDRDARNRAALIDSGWRVVTVWECAIKNDGLALIDELVALIKCLDGIEYELPKRSH